MLTKPHRCNRGAAPVAQGKWSRLKPPDPAERLRQNKSPHLLEFWSAHPQNSAGKLALVIGTGLGDDAEQVAAWGFETTAFDISPTAICACRKRFPASSVHYAAANLLDPPAGWLGKFDFVFEANTIQALPAAIRSKAIERAAQFARPGGLLLVVARAREPEEHVGELPWPAAVIVTKLAPVPFSSAFIHVYARSYTAKILKAAPARTRWVSPTH
ncbi:MAG: class I SAM-dependent methyltransferase [Bryobacteraceae bacterium]